MLSQTLLLTLASTALAALAPGHLNAVRQLQARQTDGTGAGDAVACATAIASIATTLPTPGPEIVSFVATYTDDMCSFTVPASLSSAFKSYEGAFSSWLTANAPKLSSAIEQCPQYSTLYDGLSDASCTGATGNSGSGGSQTTGASGSESTASSGSSSVAPVVSSGSNIGSGSGSGSGSGAGNGTATTAATATSTSKNAGQRETGLAGAALAFAGFLGVVAAL